MRPKQPNRNSLVFPMRPKQPQQRLRRLSAVGRSRSWVWSKSGMVHPHLLSALPRLGDEEPRDLLPQSLPGQPDSPALEPVSLLTPFLAPAPAPAPAPVPPSPPPPRPPPQPVGVPGSWDLARLPILFLDWLRCCFCLRARRTVSGL